MGLAVLAVCASALSASRPLASPAAQDNPAVFAIAPQPLDRAIEAYSTVTGVTVLYEQPAAAQVQSPGAIGTLSAQAGLQALLEGTGLIARFTDARDAVLVPIPNMNQTTASLEPPPPDGPTLALETLHVEAPPPPPSLNQWLYDQYARVVQSNMQRVIQKSVNAQRASYHIVLEVWIDGAGRVNHARLIGTTGRPQLDRALAQAVNAATVDEPPPAGMLQPVSIEVHMRAGF